MNDINPSVPESTAQRSQAKQKQNATKGNAPSQPHMEGKIENKHLIGTFTSVLIVGAILVASWFGVYALYLNRL